MANEGQRPLKGSHVKAGRGLGGQMRGCELSSSLESLHGGARRAPPTQNSLQEQRDLQWRHQASTWIQSNVCLIYDTSPSPESRICWPLPCKKQGQQEISSSREMSHGMGIARKRALNAFKNAANHSELCRNDFERGDYVRKVWTESCPPIGRFSVRALG